MRPSGSGLGTQRAELHAKRGGASASVGGANFKLQCPSKTNFIANKPRYTCNNFVTNQAFAKKTELYFNVNKQLVLGLKYSYNYFTAFELILLNEVY